MHSLPRTHGPSGVWWVWRSRGSRRVVPAGVPSFHPPIAGTFLPSPVRGVQSRGVAPFVQAMPQERKLAVLFDPATSVSGEQIPATGTRPTAAGHRSVQRCCCGIRCSRRFASGPALEASLVGPRLWRRNREPVNVSHRGIRGQLSLAKPGWLPAGRIGPTVGGGA